MDSGFPCTSSCWFVVSEGVRFNTVVYLLHRFKAKPYIILEFILFVFRHFFCHIGVLLSRDLSVVTGGGNRSTPYIYLAKLKR